MEEELTIELVQQYLKSTSLALHSTHGRVSFPIIYRIYNKLRNGERFNKIWVDGDIIVNGHHRYICLHMLKIPVEWDNWTRSLSIDPTPWNQVIVDSADWDNRKMTGK